MLWKTGRIGLLAVLASFTIEACSPSTAGNPGGSGGPGGAGGSGGDGGGSDGGAGGSGTGGSGGLGGSGGHGGHGGSGGLAGWWDDPAIWTPIPGAEAWWDRCHLLQADPEAIRQQVLTWEPCGAGCERASLDLGFENLPGVPAINLAEGSVLSGAILTLNIALNENGRFRDIRHTFRLDDGMRIAMEQVSFREPQADGTSPCDLFPPSRSMVAGPGVQDDRGTNHTLYGFVHPETGTHAWFLPWTTRRPVCGPLPALADGNPVLFFNCGTAGYLAPAGGAAEAHVVSGDGVVIDDSASSFGNHVVWSELGTDSVNSIRTWSAETGTRTLIESIPGLTCKVDLSADAIAGWRPNNNDCWGKSPGFQIWHASRRPDGSVGEVRHVDFAAEKVGVESFFSRKGFAALHLRLEDAAGTRSMAGAVVRLSDGAARRIVPQPGLQVHWGTVAMTDRHVYWAEGRNVTGDGSVSVVFRHELAQFEALGTPFVQ